MGDLEERLKLLSQENAAGWRLRDEALKKIEVLEALPLAIEETKPFITSNSCGPDSKYELVMKFKNLEDLQRIHGLIVTYPNKPY